LKRLVSAVGIEPTTY